MSLLSIYLSVEIRNIRQNKAPEQEMYVSYKDDLKPFTAVNTENIYLDNSYIQQVCYPYPHPYYSHG